MTGVQTCALPISGSTGVIGFTGSAGSIGVGYTGSIGSGYTGSAGSSGYTGSTGVGYTGSSAIVSGGNPGELLYQAPIYGGNGPLASFTIANNPTNGLRDSDVTFTSTSADFTVKFEVLGTRPTNSGNFGIGYYNVTTNTRTQAVEWADYAAYGPALWRRLINYSYGTWDASTPFRLQVVKSGSTLTWTFLNTSDST